MRALVQQRYGRPSRVLSLRQVEAPAIGDDGVLVRVVAASLNAMDWHLIMGRPMLARATTGLTRPKQVIPGTDLAGIVEAVGPAVTELGVGDAVFGGRDGAFADVVAGRARNFVRKPASLGFAQAAALPIAGVTALQAVRDHGGLEPGETVLVLGAGGGVGSYAVQIAVADGGHVTAVTGPATMDLVQGLGAERVVSRTDVDRLPGRERFDLVIDAGGFASSGQLGRLLSDRGRAVIVGAGDASSLGLVVAMAGARLRTALGQRPLKNFIARLTVEHLAMLAALAERGALTPAIGATVGLEAVPAALDVLAEGRARGKTVVAIGAA